MNALRTTILLAGMTALFMGVGYMIGGTGGMALAFLFEINITLAVFAVSVMISLALLLLQKRATLSSDALLGLLSHSALALGLVALAFMTWVRMDLMGLLFGDILAVSKTDIAVIWAGGIAVLVVLALK